MKAFLVTVSSLCFCAILFCFLAYATDRLRGGPAVTSSQPVEISQVDLNPDQIGVPSAMEEDLLCAPCVERIAFFIEMIEQEGEENQNSRLETAATPAAQSWAGLLPEQREKTRQFFDQYGPEEGLRRLRKFDTAAAAQSDQKRREPSVRSVLDEAVSSAR